MRSRIGGHCEGFVADIGHTRGGNQELHATGADARLFFQLQLAGEAESPGNTLETGRRYGEVKDAA